MRMIRLIATKITLMSSEAASIYKQEIWKLHGISRKIISNQGPQFASVFMKALCKSIGTEQALLTAYHLQSDG